MPVGGVVDLAQPTAERHLRLWIEIEPRKHQHAVVFERLEHRFAEQIIGSEPVGVDADHLGADRLGQLVDGEQTHRLSFLGGCARHGTGSPMRSMTASAESVGFCWPKTSMAIETMIIE